MTKNKIKLYYLNSIQFFHHLIWWDMLKLGNKWDVGTSGMWSEEHAGEGSAPLFTSSSSVSSNSDWCKVCNPMFPEIFA